MSEEPQDEIKYPFRNLGPKKNPVEQAAEKTKGPEPAPKKSEGVIQQSVFQTPVEAGQMPQEIPEDMRIIAEAQAAERERIYQAWDKKRLQNTIITMLVLGLAGYFLALPTTADQILPIGSCILGLISGAIIGWNRLDDFWARIIHTLPQIIWSIASLLMGWQVTGFAFVIVAAVWAFHFIIATLAALKIQFDSKVR